MKVQRAVVDAPRVAVVVLNWRSPTDTLACVESLRHLNRGYVDLYLCDNDSRDGSEEIFRRWLDGEIQVSLPAWFPSSDFHRTVFALGKGHRETSNLDALGVAVLQTGGNLGYAGGNNVGLRHALNSDVKYDYFWILNNDTLVAPDALVNALLTFDSFSTVGAVGSLLANMDSRDRIQGPGGLRFISSLCMPREIASGGSFQDWVRRPPFRVDYPSGAAILVSRDFLDRVGLMSETYFLYFEEVDWMFRARRLFSSYACPGSIVWHKEGGAAGTSDRSGERPLPLYLYHRNRLVFADKYLSWQRLTVRACMIAEAVLALIKGYPKRARIIVQVLLQRYPDGLPDVARKTYRECL